MSLRRLIHRLLALGRADHLDADLEAEIAAHLELAERDAIASGLSPVEARRHARRAFGPIEPMREAHRDDRSARWLEYVLRDARHGLASLRREPAFAGIAIGVLALGIGATAAMFSLVDGVLLKPLPYPEPERIVRVWEAPRPGAMNATSTLDFLDWRRLGTSFEALAAERPVSAALTGGGDAIRLDGRAVTSDYFAVFATAAALGRTFAPADERPGADPVVVLSHAAWQTHFGGDPDILRRRPVLDGAPHQVIGVLPPGAFDRDRARYWTPLVFGRDQHRRDYHWLGVQGRLKPGVTLSQAREEMQALDAALDGEMPVWKRGWTIVVEPIDALMVGDALRRSLVIGFGAVVFVLLIACANVASLLAGRGVARAKELAVRAALGASRGRVVAQLLIETLVLCGLGAAGGVGLAFLLIEAAAPLAGGLLPSTAEVSLDARVLAFSAIVTAAVALLVGLLPALHVPVGDLARTLGQSGRGVGAARGRLRRAMVIGEVALSLVLVCGALLLFRSLANLQRLQTGIRIDHVMTMSIDLPEAAYSTPERVAVFYESLTGRLEGAPGIAHAALTTHLPLRWIGNGEGLFVDGAEEPVNVRYKRVDAGYFAALDIPVLAGRGIGPADRAGAPHVAVINEALASRLKERFSLADPIGRTVQLTAPEGRLLDVQVVGIVRGERVAAPGRPDPPVFYMPLAQAPERGVKLLVRTFLDTEAAVPAIREAVRRLDPNLPIGDVATMAEVRDTTLEVVSRPAWLIGAFAGVAALLAALGLYGVVGHAVAERRREIGIRMAMGARVGDVVAQVLRSTLAMVAVGLALGLAGALGLTGVLRSLLFDVSPSDPAALGAASVAMVGVGLAAGAVPASRAARVHPVEVLREDG
jgi:putative ABC transport system permease protein